MFSLRTTIPFSQNGLLIQRKGSYVRIEAKLGLVVMWNEDDTLWVSALLSGWLLLIHIIIVTQAEKIDLLPDWKCAMWTEFERLCVIKTTHALHVLISIKDNN